ncbi:class I SAM-dependent methyltransferase [Emcibacter sp.]|uniref:class I SAM-dependent methyltransferase n=1 Tax=Emcibacter sp. TaxID=1979954 RepID=UPI002AA674A9|nr:class I SAM-dependent methyltransferase [Emcibacter sp.]
MGFYSERILPHIVNAACGMDNVKGLREKVVPHAQGRILEVGFGSGHNLPYYTADKVEKLWALEPSEGMRKLARDRVSETPFEVDYLGLEAEEIPLDENSVDTIVMTYTLCTIPDTARALKGMKRVLKPGGRLLFSEHGRAPDEAVAHFQDRWNNIWKKVLGGCNLNRDINSMIREAGFKPEDMTADYIEGPKFASFMYWGSATKD